MLALLDSVRSWLRQQRDIDYVAGMGASEFADIGLSRSDAMVLAAAPSDTRERLEAMARARGLPLAALDAEHWRAADMARACAQCGERRRCRHWLRGRRYEGPEAFCPNANHFATLLRREKEERLPSPPPR